VEALVLRAFAERGGERTIGFLQHALETDERHAWAIVRHFVLFGGNPVSLVDGAEQIADVIRRERGESLRRAFLDSAEHRAAGAGPAADAVRDALQRAERGEPLEDARAALDRFLAGTPGAGAPGPGTAAATLELGRLLLGRGRPAEALERFESARSLGADSVETDLLAGEALLREGRREDARARFETAEPKALGVRKLLARAGARRAAGDGPGAREAAAAAVREAPGDPAARLALAGALLVGDLIEPDGARAEARWALAIAGRSDAEALVLAALGDALAVVATPRIGPQDFDVASSLLGNGWREVDRLARSANARVLVALAFLRLPHPGAHQIGQGELDAARSFDPPGLQRLRKNDPELARALGD
jgi:tetratricopeptide (TPR) repeat protein